KGDNASRNCFYYMATPMYAGSADYALFPSLSNMTTICNGLYYFAEKEHTYLK
ncbi:hypothetical protein BgiMline_030499, partial [Biomphalaria glabrata]